MYKLKVESMTCGHCMSRVTRAVMSVDPEAKVDIDLPRREVRVKSARALLELTDALAKLGYPAKQFAGCC